MNYELRTDPMIKLFNPSIGRLQPTRTTKNLILASLLVGALVSLLSAPAQAAGSSPQDRGGQPADTFSILLEGPYKHVVHGPDLGLSKVDLSDGTFSKTKIFPVSGLPEEDSEDGNRGGTGDRDGETKKRIGNFYVQFSDARGLAAYDLPGGALTMHFTEIKLKPVPDGQGGTYLVGTAELDITEATGIYQSFIGGHNTMVDILHMLPDGSFVEHCICIISRVV